MNLHGVKVHQPRLGSPQLSDWLHAGLDSDPRQLHAGLQVSVNGLGDASISVQELQPEPTAPRIARRHTQATLQAWGLVVLCDDAAIIVSELVTNALRYALCADVESSALPALRLVLVRHVCHLICIVTDPGDLAPRLREPDITDESGRGLQVIAALSQSWGVTPTDAGKAVWARLGVPGCPGDVRCQCGT